LTCPDRLDRIINIKLILHANQTLTETFLVNKELTDRALEPRVCLVIVFPTADEACLVRMLEHTHKAFTNRFSDDVVFISFLPGSFILISELFKFLCLYFPISFVFQSDVI
jgi:hypothetical protein